MTKLDFPMAASRLSSRCPLSLEAIKNSSSSAARTVLPRKVPWLDDAAFAHDCSRVNERLEILEHKVSHMEEELDRMTAQVDEWHAILLQARGVRWAVITVSGLVGFFAGIAHWFIARA
jgi:hypothetical protein